MRKFLFSLALGLLATFTSFAQNQLVTFQVSNPDSTPVYVFGSWSGWTDYPGTPMVSIGNGIYSATIPLAASSSHEYLFVNGTAPYAKEALLPSMPCTNGNAQYTNRTLSVGTADMTVCSEWGTCTACPGTAPTTINVTFQVQNPDSTPVYVFGAWSGWSNYPGTPMTSIGNGMYSASLPLSAGTRYEYLFVNGNAPFAKEGLDPAGLCTNGNGQFTNRVIVTGSADQTICSIWGTCNTCQAVQPRNIDVTFRVESPDSTPVYVFGNWNGWNNWPGQPMTLIGGTTYETTVSILENQAIEYLYVNGTAPYAKEAMMPSMPCTNGNQQFTNRVAQLGSSNTTLCNVWATCNACSTIGIDEENISNMKLMISRSGLTILSEEFTQVDELEVYDVLGRNIYSSNNKLDVNALVPMSLNENTLYLIRVKSNNKNITFKGIIAE